MPRKKQIRVAPTPKEPEPATPQPKTKDKYDDDTKFSGIKPLGYICLRCGAIYKTETQKDKCKCPK